MKKIIGWLSSLSKKESRLKATKNNGVSLPEIPPKHKREYQGVTRTTPKENPNTPKENLKRLEIMSIGHDYSGLVYHSPTESQLSYAKSLGIDVPKWASKSDVSILITRVVNDNDYSAPNPDLVDYAISKGVNFSRCVGKKAFYNIVFDDLSDLDKVAFFAFSLYRWLSGERHGNLETFPYKRVFDNFAAEFVKDESFMNSLKRYKGSDLRYFGEITLPSGYVSNGGSVRTFAYKKTSAFLQQKFEVPLSRTSF